MATKTNKKKKKSAATRRSRSPIRSGPGYRFIKQGETVVKGDEFFSPIFRKWCPALITVGEPLQASSVGHYRRKIEAEKAPEQPATTPALAIGEGYRQLQPFEVVAEGDEMFSNLFGDPQWVPCRASVGLKVSFFPDSTFRRKVETPATPPATKVLPVDAVVTINLTNPDRFIKCTRLEGGQINVQIGTVGQPTTSASFGLSPEGAQALSLALSIVSNSEVGQ